MLEQTAQQAQPQYVQPEKIPVRGNDGINWRRITGVVSAVIGSALTLGGLFLLWFWISAGFLADRQQVGLSDQQFVFGVVFMAGMTLIALLGPGIILLVVGLRLSLARS